MNYSVDNALTLAARKISLRTRGKTHGPITRIVSPSDIGKLIKPFVFLDYFDVIPSENALFPMHPHSGIATITVLLEGDLRYEDTTGATGVLSAGSVEWMQAGNGIWHDGSPIGKNRFVGYQLWVALPRSLENAMPLTQYLPAEDVPYSGPARLVLGSFDGADSPIDAPRGMNLLHVRLEAGKSWHYQPPAGHTVAWAHVNTGLLEVCGVILEDELAVFDTSEDVLKFTAHADANFLVASAIPHPHNLTLGHYSVHTSSEALRKGEAEIVRIAGQLRAEGRLS